MDCVVDKSISEHKIEFKSIILQKWLRGQIFCVGDKDLWAGRKGNFDTRIEFRLMDVGVL